jgi:hypothetical protein
MDYSGKYKYPRTPLLPWSDKPDEDDIVLDTEAQFEGHDIVVTEKMDGENFTLYSDYCHARSIDGRHHPSRDWIKQLQGRVGHHIPEDWRICGENLYAEHSIRYEDLESYYYVFSVWNDHNECLSWDETVEWCEMLDLVHVPVLYRGPWDGTKVREAFNSLNLDKQEGIVVRRTDSFAFEDFQQNIAKWVRPNHVQTDEHWMHKEVVPNDLKEE